MIYTIYRAGSENIWTWEKWFVKIRAWDFPVGQYSWMIRHGRVDQFEANNDQIMALL